MRDWIEPNLERLYCFAYSLEQDRDSARDLVQECVLHAIEARKHPDEAVACRAWLFRILRNCFIDTCRKSGQQTCLDDIEDIPADDCDPWSSDPT